MKNPFQEIRKGNLVNYTQSKQTEANTEENRLMDEKTNKNGTSKVKSWRFEKTDKIATLLLRLIKGAGRGRGGGEKAQVAK